MTVQKVEYYFIDCDDCLVKYAEESDDAHEVMTWAKNDHWRIVHRLDGTLKSVLCPKCAKEAERFVAGSVYWLNDDSRKLPGSII